METLHTATEVVGWLVVGGIAVLALANWLVDTFDKRPPGAW